MSPSPLHAALRGSLDGRGLRIGIVVSRFNEDITSRLLDGALAALDEMGVAPADRTVCSVPGAVEIPGAALALARKRCQAVIALGAVIRGETSHYDTVCRMAADGCVQVAIATGIPVSFGVLTCETEEQALARAGAREANKGFEAARVAVEMARLFEALRS